MQPTGEASSGGNIIIEPGMSLPLPDDAAALAARERLASIDIGVSAPTLAALGMLAEPVMFIAAVQGNPYPRPLLSTRVVVLTGSHAGGVVAGQTPDPRNSLPLQHLAVAAGAGIVTLEWQPASAAIEFDDAITPSQMEAALRAGWAEAERAADEGIELIVLAAGGPGASTAAAAVIAAITGAEPQTLLGRVVTPAGIYDDNAWMTRCLALRDALRRVRNRDGDPRTVLCALGGADIAAATGLLLGAASRRTPVMIDGPVGAAAALLANDFSPAARRWIMLPDAGRHPSVRLVAESLELRPWLDLCLDIGEGATALAALPILQMALTLAGLGEPVEAAPLTRYDSTGNQVFVGVAKAVEPAVNPQDVASSEVATELATQPEATAPDPTEALVVAGTAPSEPAASPDPALSAGLDGGFAAGLDANLDASSGASLTEDTGSGTSLETAAATPDAGAGAAPASSEDSTARAKASPEVGLEVSASGTAVSSPGTSPEPSLAETADASPGTSLEASVAGTQHTGSGSSLEASSTESPTESSGATSGTSKTAKAAKAKSATRTTARAKTAKTAPAAPAATSNAAADSAQGEPDTNAGSKADAKADPKGDAKAATKVRAVKNTAASAKSEATNGVPTELATQPGTPVDPEPVSATASAREGTAPRPRKRT